MSKIAELISELNSVKAQYNLASTPPASFEELQRLREEAQQALGYAPPQAYLDVLALTNGIGWNGYQLYASQAQTRLLETGRVKYLFRGFVEVNKQWREFEPNQQYVFFAESGDLLYCHNLESGHFEVVDRITKEMDDADVNTFATCDALLAQLFNHMLDRYSPDEEAEA